MSTLLNALFAIALAGFYADLVVHITALAGSSVLFEQFGKYMFPALFIVWVPTILVMNRLTRDVKQRDLWKASLRGCPTWMRTSAYVVFGYAWASAMVNMLLFGNSKLAGARSASSIMLGFFGIAACVLYSANHVAQVDDGRLCLNGHRVGPLAKFCEECGAPVAENPMQDRSFQ
ncbi:MAG TPA: hypothetical protein VK976_06100 [Verrucomicrobiae bacterium]|nr:hypothetical protein [Verrucomicrobiae bacterium]